MENTDARVLLQHVYNTYGYQISKNFKDNAIQGAFELADKALEKQIPNKPIKNSQFEDFKCPVCGSPDIRSYDTEYCRYDKEWVFDYCSDCGQKIDWSDEE